jgi:hypothetical protein
MLTRFFPRTFFFYCLPSPERLSFLNAKLLFRYMLFYVPYKEFAIEYHRQQISGLDSIYQRNMDYVNLKCLCRLASGEKVSQLERGNVFPAYKRSIDNIREGQD